MSILSVDINHGQVIVFDETMSLEERVQGVLASGAIQFVLPPREMDDLFMVDGAAYSRIDIGDPVERCRE